MDDISLIIILIFAGQILGSLIGIVKKPGKLVLYGSLAFAASMMLGISFFQLIPESLELTSPSLVAGSFLLGIALMKAVDYFLPHINPQLMKKERPSVKRSVTMLIIGMGLHNIPEGLAIGAGLAASPTLGILIALGIAMQDVPENIATIIPLYGLTKKRLKSFLITTGTVLFEFIGFVFGYFVIKEIIPGLLGASLALAAGFMTYISVDELIPTARIRENSKVGLIGLVLGVLCTLALAFLGG